MKLLVETILFKDVNLRKDKMCLFLFIGELDSLTRTTRLNTHVFIQLSTSFEVYLLQIDKNRRTKAILQFFNI